MANFKAPIAPIFNGEQFELVNGNVINAKGISDYGVKINVTGDGSVANPWVAALAPGVTQADLIKTIKAQDCIMASVADDDNPKVFQIIKHEGYAEGNAVEFKFDNDFIEIEWGATDPALSFERVPADPTSFNIEIGYDATENKYACNHNLAEIAEAVGKGADINVKFTGADGKVSYDQWGIDEIDATKVVFKNGYYRNDEDYERCWIEESIELLAAYAKDAKTLELVEKVVYSRDYKIKYACGTLPDGAAAPVGKFPAPKFVSEVLNETSGEYEGRFELIDEDLVAPTATVEGLAFDGWCYDKACTQPAEVDHVEITKDIKLYAKWVAAAVDVTYSVQFMNMDGGSQTITVTDPAGTVVNTSGASATEDPGVMSEVLSPDIQRWMDIAGTGTHWWSRIRFASCNKSNPHTITESTGVIEITMSNAS